MEIKDILQNLGLKKELFIFFLKNFQEHNNILQSFLDEGYNIQKIFFRDILSGEYPEIECENKKLIKKTIGNGKSELVPVIVFTKEKTKFSLELHYTGNPF